MTSIFENKNTGTCNDNNDNDINVMVFMWNQMSNVNIMPWRIYPFISFTLLFNVLVIFLSTFHNVMYLKSCNFAIAVFQSFFRNFHTIKVIVPVKVWTNYIKWIMMIFFIQKRSFERLFEFPSLYLQFEKLITRDHLLFKVTYVIQLNTTWYSSIHSSEN